ncbi:ATP-binding protein [Heliophilum fasciatum]|uniref:histidine kinase n=1 Tax=Heliophilum fasciatum TaxID=35700 RepID=A0A4V2SWT4_9FIRM|nr:ATP-binding protein [Heliophilum fasciatum]MCW2278571.1 signal transduction histidine kinase [Heliophilum fasciatum]TCP63526.1 signal transduction histidine kinase [Heliophilum fasciatum]
MQMRLRTRLSLAYALLAVFLVVLISVLTNVFLEKQFKEYIVRQQEARNIEIVSMLSRQYDQGENRWNNSTVQNIGVSALEQGLIVKVMNPDGSTVWDAVVHNNGLCTQMIDHMAHNMTSRYPDFEGAYEVQTYPLMQDGVPIGTVDIGYYGPFYFTDNDLAFINTLNQLLAGAGLIALLLALLLGSVTAKRLSRPISKAVEIAKEIGHGHYDSRILDTSNTLEINKLTSTINELAEGLANQEKLRKRLTVDIAHELRTPLTTLQSHMEAMIDGIWQADRSRLESCHEEILRINRMVGDLEKLARYESEDLVLYKEEFDLQELTGYLLKNFEADFRNKNIAVTLQGEQALIVADRDKISQVIVNLLSNAIKYTSAEGAVAITITCEQDQIRLNVRDNGIGIAPKDLPHIFERFYRADRSRTRNTGGAGVGLAIVKAIVTAHGGTVRASSTDEEGTVFTVTLPAP